MTLMREKGISDPDLAEQLYFERRMGEGTQNYSPMSQYSELPFQYQPRSETRAFDLPVFSLPKESVEISLAKPDLALYKKFIQQKTVSFCIHPATLALEKERNAIEAIKIKMENPLKVAPAACSRTVIVLDSENPLYAIKCHCPFRISRFYRNLGPLTIRHCVTISGLLEKTSITYLPESMGIALPSTEEKRGFGFIVREYSPNPRSLEKRKIIPCFALYGKDRYEPNAAPLIVKIIKKFGKNPKEFVLQNIMFPIIRDFLSVFKTQGILLEAHGQNTLLEVDEEWNSTRVVHRDFDNYVDHDFRRSLGLSVEGLKTFENYFSAGMLSLIYDNSIAHHHFEFLSKVIEEHFDVPTKEFQRACSAYFQDIFPEYLDFFPKQVYYYAKEATSPNNYPLAETQRAPSWRPL